MSYIKINSKQVPLVRQIAISNGNRTHVRCAATNDRLIGDLYDFLVSFGENNQVVFDIVSTDLHVAQFDGYVRGVKKHYSENRKIFELNFTAEPKQ